jgi:hypothetical protein
MITGNEGEGNNNNGNGNNNRGNNRDGSDVNQGYGNLRKQPVRDQNMRSMGNDENVQSLNAMTDESGDNKGQDQNNLGSDVNGMRNKDVNQERRKCFDCDQQNT